VLGLCPVGGTCDYTGFLVRLGCGIAVGADISIPSPGLDDDGCGELETGCG